MKKYIQISIVAASLISCLYAVTEDNNTQNQIGNNLIKGDANTNDNVVNQYSYGQKVEVSGSNNNQSTYNLPPMPPNQNWDREKILLYKQAQIDKTNAMKYATETGQTGIFVNPSIIEQNRVAIQSSLIAQQTQQYQNTRMASAIKGDCVVPNDIMVSEKPQQIKVPCKIESTNEYINIMVMLIPDNKSFMLNALPVYYIDSNNQLIKADQSMSHVTNIDDTSSNVASIVNTQELKKTYNAVLKGATDGMTKAGQSALENLAASQKEELQTVVGSSGGSTVVESTNTKRPTSKDYLEYGLVGLAIGTMQGIGQIAETLSTDLPWLYYVNKGSVLHFYITPLTVTQQQIYQTQQTTTQANTGVQQ